MSSKYHKIITVFERDPDTKFRTLLEGEYATPEFEFLADLEWIFTEKVDGTNIRVIFKGTKIVFGGKSDQAQIPATLVNKLQERFFPLLDTMKTIFNENGDDCDVCLYGEGYGAKIQKGGGNYRPDQDFVLFDVKIGDWWLQRADVKDISKKLSLDIVPIIGRGTLPEMVRMASKGFSSTWGQFTAEGIVARPATELRSRSGHRIITKIKHKDFAK